ncbi:GDNF family receptor alpha-like [Cottoperca gobio]|uniref:GDNF family receptor alpha-like n=1 Tax=Cottoperca gobio TaxID=56716 RepID=A0A6J2R9V3_COTGO|nr:GDNF family receptor alpha-like [Cottoperca gobio]
MAVGGVSHPSLSTNASERHRSAAGVTVTAIMQPISLEAAVILGIVIHQISSISISSPPADCFAAVETCMSNLCKWSEEAFYGSICEDDGCQIKGSEVCNLTIQTVLDQFPSLHGCVCAREEELCGSIQALATQCHQKTVQDGAASCLDQMGVCVSDAVCNRYLAPVIQACMAQQCDRDRCQKVSQQFYGSMPHNVAEILVMCECEASDQSCLDMKTVLHSGTCGDHTWICQDTVNQCVEDSNCRYLLKTFRAKCWSPEEAQCSDIDLQKDECISQMNQALILGADSECKIAFLATLGTALHYPCACNGMRNDDLLTCNMIYDVLHNRSHFMTSWKSNSGPTKSPEIDEPEQGHTWSHGFGMPPAPLPACSLFAPRSGPENLLRLQAVHSFFAISVSTNTPALRSQSWQHS